jgi:hypothetical protein
MGSLTPNVPLVYESPDGGNTVYAREVGAPANTRKMVGQSYEAKNRFEQIQEDKLWGEIRRAARTNPALQKALEQCIIIHHLSKDKETVAWHPV